MQGNPVRKGPYAPEHYPGVDYEPDLHRPCTIFAGSVVQQVCPPPVALLQQCL